MPEALPDNNVKWTAEVKRKRLTNKSLFVLESLKSASKITRPQFLMLRFLYKKVSAGKTLYSLFESGDIVPPAVWTEVTSHLNGSKNFKEYLESVSRNGKSTGPFSAARSYQKRCCVLKSRDSYIVLGKINVGGRMTCSRALLEERKKQSLPSLKPLKDEEAADDALAAVIGSCSLLQTPKQATSAASASGSANDDEDDLVVITPYANVETPIPSKLTDPEYRVVEDEQIVNFALSLLLDSLVEDYPSAPGYWSPYRAPFSVTDSGLVEFYQARVDGIYRWNGKAAVKFTIEVKSNSRAKGGVAVDMQESAQMAAWIAATSRAQPNFRPKVNESVQLGTQRCESSLFS